jgi:hypothetical protein
MNQASMNPAMRIKPWYREPWPWIVMSGPAVVVVASIVSAYLAVHGADPVVDENYYQHGLQINAELARNQRAQALQIDTDLHIAGVRRGDEVQVVVRAADGHPLTDTALRLRLVRDGNPASERSAVIGRVPAGGGPARFYGQWLQAPDDGARLADGTWRVIIEAMDWRLEGPATAQAHLAARQAGLSS